MDKKTKRAAPASAQCYRSRRKVVKRGLRDKRRGIFPNMLFSRPFLAKCLLLGAFLVANPQVEPIAVAQQFNAAQNTLPPSEPLLSAALFDLLDKPASLRGVQGKVVVVLHQDRHSSEQNEAFKDKLSGLIARFSSQLRVVALADAGGYDFWPAKGYVKDALRSVEKKGGAMIVVDWKGAVRKAYRLKSKQSAVFVLNRSQELVAFSQGQLTPTECDKLSEQVESLLVQETASKRAGP